MCPQENISYGLFKYLFLQVHFLKLLLIVIFENTEDIILMLFKNYSYYINLDLKNKILKIKHIFLIFSYVLEQQTIFKTSNQIIF